MSNTMKRVLFSLFLWCWCAPALANYCVLPVQELATRPSPAQGPTDVVVRLYVNDIVAIHDADQSFTGDVLFRAEWMDSRLAHAGEVACIAAMDQVWTPLLQLLNRRRIEKIREPQLSVAPNGLVTLILRSYGEFSFRADLTDFPFDQQELSFNVVSTYSEQEVRLRTQMEFLGLAEQLSVANWTITIDNFRARSEYVPAVDKHLARLDLVLTAQRLTSYYTWQQLLPLLLVVMMTWVVFWIPLEFVPPRVGLAATSMLTLIAYRFAMSSVLPPIAYLTRLDVFMIGSSILVFCALAIAVAATYIEHRHNPELAERVNRAARWLSPLGLLLVSAYAFYG
jgi:hypothetical protein